MGFLAVARTAAAAVFHSRSRLPRRPARCCAQRQQTGQPMRAAGSSSVAQGATGASALEQPL